MCVYVTFNIGCSKLRFIHWILLFKIVAFIPSYKSSTYSWVLRGKNIQSIQILQIRKTTRQNSAWLNVISFDTQCSTKKFVSIQCLRLFFTCVQIYGSHGLYGGMHVNRFLLYSFLLDIKANDICMFTSASYQEGAKIIIFCYLYNVCVYI